MKPRFRSGDRIRVRAHTPQGHHRTPGYVKGRSGVVVAVQGSFRNPEDRAYGGDGLPPVPLYTVQFRQGDLWEGYPGPREDTLWVDLFEHWLESAGGER